MALPTSVIASDAGTSAANGTYSPATGANATYGGITQYTNGVEFATYTSVGGAQWVICTGANTVGTYLYTVAGTATAFPLTGWIVSFGTSYAPTFTIGNTSNPNLTSMMVY